VLALAIILLPILENVSDRRRTIAVPSSPYLLESFLEGEKIVQRVLNHALIAHSDH